MKFTKLVEAIVGDNIIKTNKQIKKILLSDIGASFTLEEINVIKSRINGNKNALIKGGKVFFQNERLPYIVMAVSARYAVVARNLNRRQDAELLHFEVTRGACHSFTEAYNVNKNNPVYSLLDFKEMKRAPDDMVFSDLNYLKEKDCKEAIKRLESGKMGLSRRNMTDLIITNP